MINKVHLIKQKLSVVRESIRFLCLITLFSVATPLNGADTFDQAGWLSDFEDLKAHVSKYYAHFDDKVAHGVNPYQINIETLKALKASSSDREAAIAIIRFVAAFRDGHFRIKNLRGLAPSFFGPKKTLPFKLKLSNGEVLLKEQSSSSCRLKVGDTISMWDGRPIKETISYAEGFYAEFNDLNRQDMALAYMTKGHLIPYRVSITSSQGVQCKFNATVDKRDPKKTISANRQLLTNKAQTDHACESFGVSDRQFHSAVSIPKEKFKLIDNPTFRIGKLGSKGYLFIPAFGIYGYRETCEREWEKYRKTFSGTCDDTCKLKFEYNILRQALTNDLEAAVSSINQRTTTSLVVDVTNNGGGSDWVDTVARVIAPKPLSCQKVAKIKNDKVLTILKEDRNELKMTLKSKLRSSARVVLNQALKNVDSTISKFNTTCDRSKYWTLKQFRPKCSVLTNTNLYACGYVPYVKPGTLDGVEIRQPVFKSSDFRYSESLFKGKIIILANRNTSSSAEEFISLIKDNIPDAKVVGEHTNSTGCGYMNGGNPITLKHSGLRINMSNCVRYHGEKVNEVFGIQPDVRINWQETDKNWDIGLF